MTTATTGHITTRTALLTGTAMLAFAANSLLCRLALAPKLIDAASFTSVRLISGAATLALILFLRHGTKGRPEANWRSVAALFAYMIFFSFAYLSLSAGTGALVLFGAVQLTMFIVALRSGEHFSRLSWAGLTLAILGLVYLVSPGVTAPDPLGAAAMAVAGISWGVYSLIGRGARDPLAATAGNFIYAVPLTVIASLGFISQYSVSGHGFALAVLSGALASACGYVIWYAALPGLTATRAATVQLSVPVIAAVGGVFLISEQPTLRLLVASAATLGGVAIVLAQRAHQRAQRPQR
ncbi:DMT family transporter [Microbaculum sp. FT89]|uniref:DMT family transporter n=1 Tax=Microbaculum sp. FT89 TaxID=3447298 RepID=UPI003F53C534